MDEISGTGVSWAKAVEFILTAKDEKEFKMRKYACLILGAKPPAFLIEGKTATGAVMTKIDESIARFLPMLDGSDVESMAEGDQVNFNRKRENWGPFKMVNMSCVKKICLMVLQKDPGFSRRCSEFVSKYGDTPYNLAVQGQANCMWAQGVENTAKQLIETKESEAMKKGQNMLQMLLIFFQQLDNFKKGVKYWQEVNISDYKK
jgi:hypothetical protein